MGEVLKDGTVVLSQPHEIEFARLATLKAGLRLEIFGMTRSAHRRSCYSLLKDMGYKGNKKSVYDQVCNDVALILNGKKQVLDVAVSG